MDLIMELPGQATAIVPAHDGAVYIVADGRLLKFREGILNELADGDIGGVTIGVDGSIYYTQDTRIIRISAADSSKTENITTLFGNPAGTRQMQRTPDGRLWAEGATQSLSPDGMSDALAEYTGPNTTPIPQTRDLYANYWTIAGTGMQTEVLVLSANSPEAWQTIPLPKDSQPADWELILADDTGMVWIGGQGGLRYLDPHSPDTGWQTLPGASGLRLSAATALALSPNGLTMAGLVSGQVIEIEVGGKVDLSICVLGEGTPKSGPVTALTSDSDGNIWVGNDSELCRISASRRAWQKKWQALGRLPGGNHDIFAAVLDGMLYTAGGATGGWGFPATPHVFDELWAYDPREDIWRVVGHLPFPRCYNGIVALGGEIWNVGGAIYTEDNINARGPRWPLADVEIYNPSTKSWRSGPSLSTGRQEPVVVTVNGRIYAIGGADENDALDSVESIGPGERAWRSEQSLPRPMHQYAGCVLDDIIYVLDQAGAFSFDPKSEQWTTLPHAPQLPQASQIAAHDGQVWVLGSYETAEGYRYDPVDKVWHWAPDLPSPNSWGAAAEFDGRLVVAGGAHLIRSDFVFDDRMYALRPDWNSSNGK